jgi:hypothetical protein
VTAPDGPVTPDPATPDPVTPDKPERPDPPAPRPPVPKPGPRVSIRDVALSALDQTRDDLQAAAAVRLHAFAGGQLDTLDVAAVDATTGQVVYTDGTYYLGVQGDDVRLIEQTAPGRWGYVTATLDGLEDLARELS